MDTTKPNYHDVESVEQFKALMEEDLRRPSLLSFWASFAEPCEKMNSVVKELADKYKTVQVLSIDAEKIEDLVDTFEIQAVPACIMLRGHTLLAKIEGADAKALTEAFEQYHKVPIYATAHSDKAPQPPPETVNGSTRVVEKEETEDELNERLKKLMDQSKVVIFMKGTPDSPRCGFSKRTVEALREQKVEFTSFDILTDESVRQGMKKLNDWPTFPQIVVNGELIGGLDILKESIASGEFAEMLK